MPKRFYTQRQHIIASLDNLLYQLLAVSFFLSPSLFLSFCKVTAQCICLKPREFDTGRALRFFYIICVLLNLPSICIHVTRGVVEGRAIILDFIGMSYSPSKFQLCCLDFFIMLLQLVLVTISYGTASYTTEDPAVDMLLPTKPPKVSMHTLPQNNASIFFSPQSRSSYPIDVIPIVIDLRLNSIATHFHHAPPSRGAHSNSLLPLPNTSPFNFSGVRTFLGPGRSIPSTTGATTANDRRMRMPGAMDATQNR